MDKTPGGRMPSRKRQAITLVLLFLVFFTVYAYNFRVFTTGDTIPASILPFNVLENHDVNFDKMGTIQEITGYYERYGWEQWYFVGAKGHAVSMYPIVTPLLATPLYAVPYLLMKLAHYPVSLYSPGFQLLAFYMERLSASFLASLSCIFVYLALRDLMGRRAAIATTFVYALATSTWSVSSQDLWQQCGSELLLAAILFLIFLNERRKSDRNVIALGVLSGLFVFNRPSDLPLLLPVLYYIFALKDRRAIYYLGALSLASLPFLSYNLYYFGSVFGGYGMYMMFNLDLRAVAGMLGLLISPGRGLFVYTPIALLAIPGFLKVARLENERIRSFLYASGIALLAFIAVYGSFKYWSGGGSYGPRFLTSALPLVALFIGLSIPEIRLRHISPGKALYVAVFLALLAVSVFTQVVGVYYYPSGGWNYSPVNIDASPGRLWDVHDNPVLRDFNAGPMVSSDPASDLSTILDFKRFELLDGWYTIEYWNKPPLVACSNRSELAIHSDRSANLTLDFYVSSYFEPRTLQLYQGENLLYNGSIPQTGKEIKVSLPVNAGQNIVEFRSAEPSDRPCDIPGFGGFDQRRLSFSFCDIYAT